MKSQVLSWIAALLLSAAFGASGETHGTVFLDELTWTELRSRISAGKTTIIVPIGGTEQNGLDMVLRKHNVRRSALSEHIARATAHALAAPVIAHTPAGS